MPTNRVQTEQLRGKIREELLKGYRPLEVKDHLGISKSAVYRHIEAIYREDANWIDDFGTKGLAITSYRLALDSLQRHKRNMMDIAEDVAQKAAFRIMAGHEVHETELDIIELQTQGPTMWALKRKADRKGQPIITEPPKQQA